MVAYLDCFCLNDGALQISCIILLSVEIVQKIHLATWKLRSSTVSLNNLQCD